MAKKNFGFSLIELLIGITIMGIMAAVITVSANSLRVTAKSEAERIAAYLIGLTHKYGSKRENFRIVLNDSNVERGKAIVIERTDNRVYEPILDTFRLRNGCTFTNNTDTFEYNHATNKFNHNGHMTITDSKGEKYVVYIYQNGGRIRTSPNENEDED